MSAVATVKGGFWPTVGVASLTQISGTGFARREAAKALAKKGNLALREIMETLNGAASGEAASKVVSRIAHEADLSGVRTIENETLVSRNTTAGDITAINEDLLSYSTRHTDPTPATNLNGNPLGSPGLF